MPFCLIVPSQQIGKAQVCPPFRIVHTLIENPFNLTPDAMLQRGQPFQNFFQSVPLVDTHHEAIAGNINSLEELPFLFHRVEFNTILIVEAVVVMLVAHQVFGKHPVFILFLWREDVLFLFIWPGVAGRQAGTLQTVYNQLLHLFQSAVFSNKRSYIRCLLQGTELQARPAFIDGALVLKQIQAEIVVERLGLFHRGESALPEDVADSGMLFTHSNALPPFYCSMPVAA